MTIRRATAADYDAMAEMGQHFLNATPYGQCVSASAETLASFTRSIGGLDTAILLVADTGDRLVGMVAGWVFPHPFSGQLVASELVWWVEPDARGSVGVRLLQAFETWAVERGATAIQMIAPEGSSIGTLYERRGYRRVEALYQRGV